MNRFIASAEEGVTLFELLVVGFIVSLFALAGYGMAQNAPAVADHTTTLNRLAAIMDRARQEAANAGALVAIAPSANNGSTITVYSGWSTVTQLDTYTLPAIVGLEDVSLSAASNSSAFYVRRNGSWYALLGATGLPCADTIRIGVYASASSVGTDAYSISCAVFAAAPVGP